MFERERGLKLIDEKDRETWVGQNRFYLDEKNILNVNLVGKIDMETVTQLNLIYVKYFNLVRGKLNCLVDLNDAGIQRSGTRKKGKEILNDERIGNVAFLGFHPVARVLASFIIGTTSKKNLRFFKTKEEALAWLKEE